MRPLPPTPKRKMRHAPYGFGLASSSLRLTVLLSYARIATVATKGPCQEASAGRQRPCTSRSLPTRALPFSTQIVTSKSPWNCLKTHREPAGSALPCSHPNRGPNFRFHRESIHGGSAGRRRRRCAARARYHRESHPSFCFTATRAWSPEVSGAMREFKSNTH